MKIWSFGKKTSIVKRIPYLVLKKKKYFKPDSLENKLNDGYYYPIAKNGRFKLYPTDNSYNFIMVDTINGKTYQVQWNIDKDKRFVIRFY